MITKFKIEDLGKFMPNQYSDPSEVLEHLLNPNYDVKTLWHDGWVAAILACRNYNGRNWMGLFLIAQDFPAKLILVLRAHIHETMAAVNAQRLHTISEDNECLNRWHGLLGFKSEGIHQKMLNNKDHRTWAIMREVI